MAPRTRGSATSMVPPQSHTSLVWSRIQWSILLVLVVGMLLPAPSAAITSRELASMPTETLVMDHRIPVKINGQLHWLDEEQMNELRKRQEEDEEEQEPTSAPEPEESEDTEESGDSEEDGGGDEEEDDASDEEEDPEPSETPTDSNPPAPEAPSPLPKPFDSNIDFNFTSNDGQSCPRYLNSLLLSDTFNACYPLSMMLETSKSFFDAARELQSIVTVLDATCAADLDFCTGFLKEESKKMIDDDNCGDEFRRQQPTVMQVYMGLNSYNVLYKATCLRDTANEIYCFANAVTNTSTPANAYPYFLPLNKTLPGGSNPACSKCLQDTMAIFHAATANRKQAIASTYESAANQVNTICGPEFVQDTLPAAVEDAGTRLAATGFAVLVSMVVVAVQWVL